MVGDEVPLAGGHATAAVVRVGDTVRKPSSSATPAVAQFMSHLRAQGIDVPRWQGRDERGRQILEHVPGELAMDAGPLDETGLRRVGQLVRRIHDASSSYVDDTATWDVLIPPPGTTELVCHNDLAPWNLILGDRWVFIDWDGAGPSTRLWDLAYSAQAFAILDPSQSVEQAAQRLRWFADGYGADEGIRATLPSAMVDRSAAMHTLLRDASVSGWEPWATMFGTGHGEYWRSAADYIVANTSEWDHALRE